jgi:hypothetical protein
MAIKVPKIATAARNCTVGSVTIAFNIVFLRVSDRQRRFNLPAQGAGDPPEGGLNPQLWYYPKAASQAAETEERFFENKKLLKCSGEDRSVLSLCNSPSSAGHLSLLRTREGRLAPFL